ncbi:hypothetical protein FHH43_07320 [Clostridium perfringens]|nr:hypothetical protein [Clostridium perfringens]
MLEKIMLSDKECEYITKSIACGVGIGLALGAIMNNPQFGFALGGVIGIVASMIYTLVKRNKSKTDKKVMN